MSGRMLHVNCWVEGKVTAGLQSMWCAYLFAAIALVSLPAVLAAHSVILTISWLSQNFIQLVALAVLGAGQARTERRVDAVLAHLSAAEEEELALLRRDRAEETGTQAQGGGQAERPG